MKLRAVRRATNHQLGMVGETTSHDRETPSVRRQTSCGHVEAMSCRAMSYRLRR